MPSRVSHLARWIVLGRVLPRRTRERIFEPAFNDQLRRAIEAQDHHALRFAGKTLAIFGGTCALSMWRVLISFRVLAVMLIIALLFLVLIQTWIMPLYAENAGY